MCSIIRIRKLFPRVLDTSFNEVLFRPGRQFVGMFVSMLRVILFRSFRPCGHAKREKEESQNQNVIIVR